MVVVVTRVLMAKCDGTNIIDRTGEVDSVDSSSSKPQPELSRGTDEDDFDGRRLVEKAVKEQNQDDLAKPVPNPDWAPAFHM